MQLIYSAECGGHVMRIQLSQGIQGNEEHKLVEQSITYP